MSLARDNFAFCQFYYRERERPEGIPASSVRAHKARAVSGVSSDGLRMIVHPAASAGAIFLVITCRKIRMDSMNLERTFFSTISSA